MKKYSFIALLILLSYVLKANKLIIRNLDIKYIKNISFELNLQSRKALQHKIINESIVFDFENFKHEIFISYKIKDEFYFIAVSDSTEIDIKKIVFCQNQFISESNKLLFEMYIKTNSFPFNFPKKNLQSMMKLTEKGLEFLFEKKTIDSSYNNYIKELKEVSNKYNIKLINQIIENRKITYFNELSYYERVFANQGYIIPEKNEVNYELYKFVDSLSNQKIYTNFYNYSMPSLIENLSNYLVVKKQNIQDVDKVNLKVSDVQKETVSLISNLSYYDKYNVILTNLIKIKPIKIQKIVDEIHSYYRIKYPYIYKDSLFNILYSVFTESNFDYQKIISLEILNSKMQKKSIKEISEGKDLVIIFWASWCSRCTKEISKYKQYRNDTNKTYINISIDKNTNQWERGLVKYDLNKNAFIDTVFDNSFVDYFQVKAVPAIFLVSQKEIDVNYNIK
jgi:hypothetical protein